MLKSINKNIAVLLTLQMILSQVAFAAESLDADTFAVKASKALMINDFSDLENGSATFNYSDNSKVYVKVSDLTVDTVASDNSTSNVTLGKQYEVCSVSADSRSVNCNYTTVRNDNTKEVKSLNIDNTAEHQIYNIPTNATYTDSDKKYFVTSFDNPYYKFRQIDENGHISGTNCIKLNSNSMVCSATADVDMSKLSASDFAQVDNTAKYQVNTDKLTNAMLTTSSGECAIDGWVQADATHCCPPDTSEYSYSWDTAQQQCKVTKHNASKSKDNSKLNDLLSAATIFASTMQQNKDKNKQTSNNVDKTTTEISENVVLQNANINKNANVNIKFNPKVPIITDELKATISVKDVESDKLVIRLQAPSTKIDTLTAKSDKEFTLIPVDKIEPGAYKLIVYVMNDGQRIATFSANFDVFDATLVLTDEQKKQYTNIELTQITDEIEQFSIAGDVLNVSYDEENSICSFDVANGYAQTGELKAFKIEESMPVEINTDKEYCDTISKAKKAYIENALLHKDGNRLGVVVNEDAFLFTDNAELFASDKSFETAETLINQTAVELGDISTIYANDEQHTVGVSFDEENNAIITDAKTNEVYSLAEYEESVGLEPGTLAIVQRTMDDTTISRVVVRDDIRTENTQFIRDAFNKKMSEMTDTIKKASRISDFTLNMLNTVEFKKKPKEDAFVQIKNGVKHFLSVASDALNKTDSNGTSVAELIQKMIKK